MDDRPVVGVGREAARAGERARRRRDVDVGRHRGPGGDSRPVHLRAG